MMKRRQRRRAARDADTRSAVEEVLSDLLVVQCRLIALEEAVPFEDLLYCRRLLATAAGEVARLAGEGAEG